MWGTDGSIFPTFDYFLQNFREVFDHPTGGKSAGEHLLVLTQGEGTAAEFALAFRTLAAQTTWVEDTLKLLFCRGLNADLQAELACRDEGRSLKELQRFLGFANFYRRFIRGYSIIAAPLTSMTRRSSQFLKWTPAALQAFADLKSRFTTAPILHHPDPSLPFIVEVDVSSTGIGAVLSQHHGSPAKMFPCAYYSRKLTPAECNYDVGNRELLAMKAALEEWWHWLEGALHPFTILTNHKNLEYLRSAKRLNP